MVFRKKFLDFGFGWYNIMDCDSEKWYFLDFHGVKIWFNCVSVLQNGQV